MNTPEELIVLVDESGVALGTAEKWSSHHTQTPLHLGFSCYVFGDDGALLVTRRAATKKVWPGVWTNTVCGHPGPGEAVLEAVQRRLSYELGMSAEGFELVLPDYIYKSPPFRGVVEHEYCPVFVARAASPPLLNSAEVDDHRWMPWAEYLRAAGADSVGAYSWWCKDQIRYLREHPVVARYARPAPTC
jgi:isopentenyl-diphosphate delta-isomerase